MASEEILKVLARPINSLGGDNKVARRKALEKIISETVQRDPALEKDELQKVAVEIHRNVAIMLSDDSEKCRELAISLIKDFLLMIPQPGVIFSCIFPIFVDRLAQKDIKEDAEELRLQLVQILVLTIELAQSGAVQYLYDYVQILKMTIADPFAEVKKESCKCAALLAKTIPAYFHQHSENLVNPLLTQISHQHSKVRSAVISCLGDVIRFGNNKSVEDVISHFAQRIFDPIPAVRMALVNVIGDWMLNLPDRYSFWHRMIPLLLSSFDDPQVEISHLGLSFWDRAGRQFEEENETELKDKLDFSIEMPAWYPTDVSRPCIGCRVLIYRNFGKFIHGIQNDISDWVVETRVKTSSLLYQCLLNVEDSVTQFLAKVFVALQKGSIDDTKEVIDNIARSSELVGFFVNPESWCQILLPIIKSAQSHAGLFILANIVRGSQPDILKHYVDQIIETVSNDDVCRSYQHKRYQESLQMTVLQLCANQGPDISIYKQQLFNVVIASIALSMDAEVTKSGYECLELLAKCAAIDVPQLYVDCTPSLLQDLSSKEKTMSSLSYEFLIFETLVLSAGSSIGIALPEISHIFQMYLDVDKDPELRLKFSTVLCKLVLSASTTLDSEGKLKDHASVLIKDVLVPNLVWKAGRTNAANRTSCVTALWAVLEGEFLSKEEMNSLTKDLIPCLTSMLEEDNITARIISTKALSKVLNESSVDVDELHKLIPELLKRLDDREDSVRIGVTKTLRALIGALPRPYNCNLYKAHCDFLYEGLLVHLDDSDPNIQAVVLQVLEEALDLYPHSLKHSIENVKHKHRTPKHCESLLEKIAKVSLASGDS